MSDIDVNIHANDGKTHRVDAPQDIKAGEFLKELLEALKYSVTDADGSPMRWQLYDRDGGRILESDRTLSENGIRAGQNLQIRPDQGSATYCPHCGAVNSPVSRFCQSCGKSLSLITRSEPSTDIKLHVHTLDGRSHSAEVPSSITAREFMKDLAGAMGLATTSAEGGEIAWMLDDKETGRTLDPDKSLKENGVLNGHGLYIRAPAPTPPVKRVISPTAPSKPVPLGKMLVGLGALVLLGIAALFAFRPKSTPIVVSVSPTAVVLHASQRHEFNASVGGSDNHVVRWSVEPNVGSISAEGVYTAPASVLTEQKVRITATSEADLKRSFTVIATLEPVTVKEPIPPVVRIPRPVPVPVQHPASPPASVSVLVAPSTASVMPGRQYLFRANVIGSSNKAVTWSVDPPLGTITLDGEYVAPSKAPAERALKVIATSKADPRKFGSATVTLLSQVEVRVSPNLAYLKPGKKQKFKAEVSGTDNSGVEWSANPAIGTISDKGEYKAPSSSSPGQIVKITATSKADPHKSDSANVTLIP